MMIYLRLLVVLCSLILFSCNVYAAGEFLDIGIGARAIGAGEAYISKSDDFSAPYWNPAGLGFINNWILGFYSNNYLKSFKLNYFSVLFPVQSVGTFGISSTLFGLDQNDLFYTTMDSSGVMVDSGETFSIYDMNFAASYGRIVYKTISVGANFKYIHSRIENEKARTFAADGGILMRSAYFDFLNVGLTVVNLGSGIKYMEVNEKLPSAVKLGYSVTLGTTDKYKVILLNDYIIPFSSELVVNSEELVINSGMEYIYDEYIFIRFGYKYSKLFYQIDMGAGVEFSLLNNDFHFSFVYVIPEYDFDNYMAFDVSYKI